MAKPTPAKQLYSDKPMSKDELAKKAGWRLASNHQKWQKDPTRFPPKKQK